MVITVIDMVDVAIFGSGGLVIITGAGDSPRDCCCWRWVTVVPAAGGGGSAAA